MHLGGRGAIDGTCPQVGKQGLWGSVSWQRVQPCKGLETRSGKEQWDGQMGDPVKPGVGQVVSARRRFGAQVIDSLGEG